MWIKRTGIRLLGYCMLWMLFLCRTEAAGKEKIVGVHTGEQEISVYVNGIQEEIEKVQCQIGTRAGQQVTWEAAKDMELSAKTLIMIDNSLSITKKNRKKIHDFLMEYVDDKEEGEQIAIAVFGEELSSVTDYTKDRKVLEEAIGSLVYQDQETYLTDVLYEVLERHHLGTEDCYKQIIIISDGVDSKEIGYTKDELYDLVRDKRYPVYTLGCRYQKNNTELENMFAIARMTGTDGFLMDETENTDDIVDAIAESRNTVHLMINPDVSEMDGGRKTIMLTIDTSAGPLQVEAEIKMPMQAETVQASGEVQDPETAQSTEEVQDPETAQSTEEVQVPEAAQASKTGLEITEEVPPVQDPAVQAKGWEIESFSLIYALAAVGGIFMVMGIAAVIILCVKKRDRSGREDHFERLEEQIDIPLPVYADRKEKTVTISKNNSRDERKTDRIWGDTGKQYTLCLTDLKHPGKSFQVSFRDSVVIGRGHQDADLVIDYDKSVSNRHCRIRAAEGCFLIRDEGSSNKTLLNGAEVLGEQEIYSGAILTMGYFEGKVEIR